MNAGWYGGTHPSSTGTRLARQRMGGQSLIEFVIIFPTLILLILGVVQFSLFFIAKSTLDQAAYNGVREGTLNNASRVAINLGIAKGLAPLYQSALSGGNRNIATLTAARLEAGLAVANPATVSVNIINPSVLSFADWGEPMTDDFGGPQTGIPNSGLLYAGTDNGATSQQSLQDANLLKIRVTYCYPMVVPIVRNVIQEILGGGIGFDALCYDSGGLPIDATSIMRMQSPAYLLGLVI